MWLYTIRTPCVHDPYTMSIGYAVACNWRWGRNRLVLGFGWSHPHATESSRLSRIYLAGRVQGNRRDAMDAEMRARERVLKAITIQ
jgi:hypothetical protein